jgi:hypothetical protein
MPRKIKRPFLKASILALVVNGCLLFAQYKQNGRLLQHDYVLVSESLATTFAVLGVVAFIVSRLNKDKESERP